MEYPSSGTRRMLCLCECVLPSLNKVIYNVLMGKDPTWYMIRHVNQLNQFTLHQQDHARSQTGQGIRTSMGFTSESCPTTGSMVLGSAVPKETMPNPGPSQD